MSPNPVALAIARRHGVPYHNVRVAVNRIVNRAGWERDRAEKYVDEVLTARNDLDEAVEAAVRDAA